MKVAAKVFTIIGIVSAIFSIIGCIICYGSLNAILQFIIQAIQESGESIPAEYLPTTTMLASMCSYAIGESVAGLVVGIIHLVLLNKNVSKGKLIPTSILSIVFLSPLAGIFSLCIRNK